MLVETKKIIPITQLQKELTKRIRELSDNHEPVYLLKNNSMEAVLVSIEEYEKLKVMEEMVEHFELGDMIIKRMQKNNPKNNIPWRKLQEI